MAYILLILTVVFSTLQNVFVKQYEKKSDGGEWLFSAVTVFFAATVFVVPLLFTKRIGFTIQPEPIAYSVLFSLLYCTGMLGQVFAIKTGSMALTSLMISFSLLIPTFFGIIVLSEKVGVLSYVGLIFLVISLYLVNYNKAENTSHEKITLKWIFFVLLASVGNGGCAVIQRLQQINQNGQFRDEFMLVALAIVFFELLTIALFTEKNHGKYLKLSIIPGMARGILNGLTNSLSVTLALLIPASVMYPVSAGGGIALTSFIAIIFYREKLSAKQTAGLVFGIISVVLLSLT